MLFLFLQRREMSPRRRQDGISMLTGGDRALTSKKGEAGPPERLLFRN